MGKVFWWQLKTINPDHQCPSYIPHRLPYAAFQNVFERSFSLITKDPMTGADVRKVFIMLKLLLEKYWEVLVDWDMSKTVLDYD